MNQRCKELFEAGVHYGHKTQSWNPKMQPFIWGKKEGIHLINVMHTHLQLEKAQALLKETASKGLPVLWVGTKKAACKVITKHAEESQSPYFANRWVGGTLTNSHEVKRAVKKMLINEEIYQKSESQDIYTKKELNTLQKKVERSKKIIAGIEKLTYPIGALIVADVQKDRVAVREALRIGVPVIGLVDTNANPEGISIVIPCNDDLDVAIDCVSKYLAQAIREGKEIFQKNNELAAEKAKVEQTLEEKKFTPRNKDGQNSGIKKHTHGETKNTKQKNDSDALTTSEQQTTELQADTASVAIENVDAINIVNEKTQTANTQKNAQKNHTAAKSKKTTK
jgi:small subunit ribosomal protein S2